MRNIDLFYLHIAYLFQQICPPCCYTKHPAFLFKQKCYFPTDAGRSTYYDCSFLHFFDSAGCFSLYY